MCITEGSCFWGQGKLVGRVFEWLLPQPVDDCLRVLSSCLLGGKSVTPLMCSTSETIGSNSADDGEDTVSRHHIIIIRFSLRGIAEGPHVQPLHLTSLISCATLLHQWSRQDYKVGFRESDRRAWESSAASLWLRMRRLWQLG